MRVRQWLALALAVTLALLAMLGLGSALAAPAGPEAYPGTVQGTAVVAVYNDTFITTTTTYPNAVRTRYHNSFDLFATADFSTTGALTLTLQFSADGENWIDGFYLLEAFSGTTYVQEVIPYRVVLTADGGSYIRNVPAVGWFMRPEIQASGNVTDGVELLIQAVLRNN